MVRRLLAIAVSLGLASFAWAQGWNIQTVDNSGNTGQYSSIAYDSQGYPHIAYWDESQKSVMYASWTGTGWYIETIPVGGYYSHAGQNCSLVLDNLDYPHISYIYYHNDGDRSGYDIGRLMYAYKDDGGWHTEVVDGPSSEKHFTGFYSSIALDNNGLPHIAYYYLNSGDLYHAWYNGSSWQHELVDGAGDVGGWTSIAIDSNNHIHISYIDFDGKDLKYAYYDGTQWSTQIVDETADVCKGTSLRLDSNGKVHIAYYDASNTALKYATLK